MSNQIPDLDTLIVMKAIDLYAGIGGWSLGLKLAGIDVVRSFEWWKPAARTHSANLSGDVHVVDIRTMSLDLVKKPNGSKIDIVVGSPPCTQFSYSNRGGSGDITDGLVDIYRFMEVVRLVKPRFWAFENVPRVASVILKEAKEGGALADFVDLFEKADVQVVDMSDFGVPQRRKRCIVGKIPFSLLNSYKPQCPQVTLGEVLQAVSNAADPIYERAQKTDISDVENETFLSDEEERFNKDMKSAHPIYNGMAFPEPLDRTSRTVTATCTRVSRESLVVGDPLHKDRFRRLSVRERASLQGFPVDYQFHGSSHAEKLKMIGNAIPPAFTYFVAHSMLGTKSQKLPTLSKQRAADLIKASNPIVTKPDRAGRSYPPTRRFRFSIPGFRFKSGTRFELSNVSDAFSWQVRFFYGDSKRIEEHVFDFDKLRQVANEVDATITASMERARE
jgi:DNA (cytosine-5)-methyltransferase 1